MRGVLRWEHALGLVGVLCGFISCWLAFAKILVSDWPITPKKSKSHMKVKLYAHPRRGSSANQRPFFPVPLSAHPSPKGEILFTGDFLIDIESVVRYSDSQKAHKHSYSHTCHFWNMILLLNVWRHSQKIWNKEVQPGAVSDCKI